MAKKATETTKAEARAADNALDTREEPRPRSNVVVYGGSEFFLEEPTTDMVIRILNVLGSLATRSEAHVQRIMHNPGNRAVMLGLLAVIHETDIIRLGSAVLQFKTDKEGRKWFKDNGVKVAPIVKALMINLSLSDDLVEALRSFFDGIGLLNGVLGKLNLRGLLTTETTEEPEASEPGGES